MKIDLKSLFNGNTDALQIDCKLHFDNLRYSTYYPIQKDVSVTGRAFTKADVAYLELQVSFLFNGFCDRCAEPVQRTMQFDLNKILAEDLQNHTDSDDDYLLIENHVLDLSRLIEEEIILFLPSKILCSEDCKGLCPKCGRNLNVEKCSCKQDVDPRMEVLLQLLDEE